MKKIILFLFTTSFLFAQDCKYKINEIDEFTKNKILETKPEILTISGMGFGFTSGCSLKKINDSRYLQLGISSPSIFTLNEGNEIIFKTEKDETIVLTFPKTIISDYISGNNIGNSSTPSRWSGTILIPISIENFERLKNELVTKLRIYTNENYIDDDISKKRAVKFKNAMNCIN